MVLICRRQIKQEIIDADNLNSIIIAPRFYMLTNDKEFTERITH